MKLNIDDVIATVKQSLTVAKVPEPTIAATLAKIAALAKEVKEEEREAATPKTRKEYGVVALETEDPDILKGYVFQLNENVQSHELIAKISAAATEYNGGKKGRKKPVKTISDTVEVIANKFFKTVGLARKTKEAVYVMKSDNQLR